MNLTVYTDGASRGNPGKSGAGIFIIDEDNKKTISLKQYLGILTNNEAEYKALIIALEYLVELTNTNERFNINFLSDSQLLVNQINGVYSVKSPNILPLYNKAKKIIANLNAVYSFKHILRTLNFKADKLANSAIDYNVEKLDIDEQTSSC
ncbi:MAG: ribonuclease HI family protein [Deltaproteobacteria bacterium]|jgi:ribonuclease HI|uniref:Ribonuclease HI family protein n=1 Tax=Candidatus Acidulodesulfobacterium acidiphilum TaxID=2597224 RepID=A0A520XES4_9DELT|nr:ribonuclease HI family protein [Deltaproteobacteria bacterium]RZV39699.1 MAG: ribonuclease HI family protein [Candidatus Acidulodesulfobacterium acidiphilum]